MNVSVGCRLVGEYIDKGEIPAGPAPAQGEAVRPRIVANFLDYGAPDDGTRVFTVLLKDGRLIAVRGHALKHAAHNTAGQDVYSIVVHANGEDVLVALFQSADVTGIFHGELRSDGKVVMP